MGATGGVEGVISSLVGREERGCEGLEVGSRGGGDRAACVLLLEKGGFFCSSHYGHFCSLVLLSLDVSIFL